MSTIISHLPSLTPRTSIGGGVVWKLSVTRLPVGPAPLALGGLGHTAGDIVSRDNGTRSLPLWQSRWTMDAHYAHTGEEATGTRKARPAEQVPSIIVIHAASIILTVLRSGRQGPPAGGGGAASEEADRPERAAAS